MIEKKILSVKNRTLNDVGNSKSVILPKPWLDIIGITDSEKEVKLLLMNGKYGPFIVVKKDVVLDDTDPAEE